MKKVTSLVMLAFALTGLSSCGNNSNSGAGQTDDSTTDGAASAAGVIGQMNNNRTAERLNLFFHLNELEQTDTSIVYEAVSLFESDTVGFNVEIAKQIDAGIRSDGAPDDDLGFTEGTIRIRSMGEPSDNFIKSLGTLFNLETTGKMRSETLTPLVFSSNKETVDVTENGTYSFKYFFENSAGPEAELFGVIDTYKRSFEWSEKDSTHRKAIIAAFQDN